MTSAEVRSRFIKFFVSKNHLEIPASSLVPEYDPTLLLTNSGMSPLKPYFLGTKEPPAKRLCNVQRCVRTEDLDNIGDPHHHTFFEMLGSWSIGDYGKKEAVEFAYELLTDKTKGFGLDSDRLHPTVFAGSDDLPADNETVNYWVEVGIKESNILHLPAKDNLWVSGPIGPCGPCTEVLYDRGEEYSCGENCGPTCECGRFYEIWNAGVFMQYNRTEDGKYEDLPFMSVDTGAGVERISAVLQKTASNYETDLFWPIIQAISAVSEKTYGESEQETVSFRVLADHIRATTFLIADGVKPSNVERGYILRKLIRRAICAGLDLQIDGYFLAQLAKVVADIYGEIYPHLMDTYSVIMETLENEEQSFGKVLQKGERKLKKIITKKNLQQGDVLDGKDAFMLYDTYGLPLSAVTSLIRPIGLTIDKDSFEKEMEAQRERARSARKEESFSPEEVKTAHTAAHLLNQALKEVLKTNVKQAGQKISPRKVRHDFTFDRKLTNEELQQVEDLVNEKIQENLPVVCLETTFEEAKARGAEAMFEDKYRQADVVTMYDIGGWSQELCGGPHVEKTGELGEFKVAKQESVGKGVRRIRGVVEN